MLQRKKTTWLGLRVTVIASVVALAQSGDIGAAPEETKPAFDVRYINDKAPAESVPRSDTAPGAPAGVPGALVAKPPVACAIEPVPGVDREPARVMDQAANSDPDLSFCHR